MDVFFIVQNRFKYIFIYTNEVVKVVLVELKLCLLFTDGLANNLIQLVPRFAWAGFGYLIIFVYILYTINI